MLEKCPQLRHVSLHPECLDLAFLQHFTHLEHLKVGLAAINIHSFAHPVMPQLAAAGALRALEVPQSYGTKLTHVLERLIANLPPRLEHLSVGPRESIFAWEEGEKALVAKSLKQLASSHPQLRSLLLSFHCRFDKREEGWLWLERMQGLEFLHLEERPSVGTLGKAIKNCKNISVISLPSYLLPLESLFAIIEGAKEMAVAYGNGKAAISHRSPNNLLVGIREDNFGIREGYFSKFARKNPTSVRILGDAMAVVGYPYLQFTRVRLDSPVLHHYKCTGV